MLCAREMRGTSSSAKDVSAARRRAASRPSGRCSGSRKPITTCRGPSRDVASASWPPGEGAHREQQRWPRPAPASRPTDRGALLGVLGVGEAGGLARPRLDRAPRCPPWRAAGTTPGTTATRVSPGQVSLSTPAFMGVSSGPSVRAAVAVVTRLGACRGAWVRSVRSVGAIRGPFGPWIPSARRQPTLAPARGLDKTCEYAYIRMMHMDMEVAPMIDAELIPLVAARFKALGRAGPPRAARRAAAGRASVAELVEATGRGAAERLAAPQEPGPRGPRGGAARRQPGLLPDRRPDRDADLRRGLQQRRAPRARPAKRPPASRGPAALAGRGGETMKVSERRPRAGPRGGPRRRRPGRGRGRPVTLAEALALAGKANPELQAAAARVEAQAARTESVRRMRWPRLGLTIDAGRAWTCRPGSSRTS